MKIKKDWIYWTPRILSILAVLFMLLMSFDVFGSEPSILLTILAFLIHNISTVIVAIIIAIAWKNNLVGAIGFLVLGILYVALVMRNPFEWYYLAWIIEFSGVSFFMSFLYYLGYKRQKV